MSSLTVLLLAFISCSCCLHSAESLSLQNNKNNNNGITRDSFLKTGSVSLATASSILLSSPNDASAADSLATKLSKRDAASLSNSIFNIPPSAQVYPKFMRGDWQINLSFAGYLFPSKSISKDKIVSNVNIPGFQKCSIASIADVGRDDTSYRMNINEKTGLEDRITTLTTSIDAHLGYAAVKDVLYKINDPSPSVNNPNRLSIDFVKNRTRNAERIELFCNARESELVPNPRDESLKIFVNSEYVRQVTFSLSQEFGVARQVVGNYGQFWTWKQVSGDDDVLTGNVLTACYLDPQDSMFFEEPNKPVAVYSHNIAAKRIVSPPL